MSKGLKFSGNAQRCLRERERERRVKGKNREREKKSRENKKECAQEGEYALDFSVNLRLRAVRIKTRK